MARSPSIPTSIICVPSSASFIHFNCRAAAIADITLRPAQKTDQSLIKKLVRDAGINPFGLHWSRFIVAVVDHEQIIGVGQVKPHRDGSQELASIAVRKDWRNQGIAGSIIRELQKQYGRPLWLTCMDRLIPFYKPFGFETIDDLNQMPRYFRTAKRFFNLYLIFARAKGTLAVMVWQNVGRIGNPTYDPT